MYATSTTIGSLTTAFQVRRLLAILALALALVAIPAFRPEEVSAHRFSEGQVVRMCSGAGGALHYDFSYLNGWIDYEMTCTLPSGNSFECFALGASFECM